MSSHREAPEISKDPVADSTDVYAFVSPDRPGYVTLIANYIPLQPPAGGPNFFEFGDDVLYEINVNNAGGGTADISYQFSFTTEVGDPNSFLYNTGPIESISSKNWNRKQFYSVTRVDSSGTHTLASKVPCPPCNVGTHSIGNIHKLGGEAIKTLSTGERVYAGQRADAFYVDLGSIFDLGDLRPFQNYFLIAGKAEPGVNALSGVNVHSIAIQVPITRLTSNGKHPSSYKDSHATIGVWTTASRQKSTIIGAGSTGPFVQVSRLGNPLVNEVLIPMGTKDFWNMQAPSGDSQFAKYVEHPELAGLLPVLYPKAFPHLRKLVASNASRADLDAILMTGIPSGIIPNFQNYTGSTQADMLRLNTAIKPARRPSILGILGGDLAGFPNGRRPFDDVTSIELRAVAGATYALVDKKYKPDAAAGALFDVVDPSKTSPDGLSKIGVHLQDVFPYLTPGWNGFSNPDKTVTPVPA
ncbi:MAG: DUF4331 domain-containing protein [Acidimicrobiales bacterium]